MSHRSANRYVKRYALTCSLLLAGCATPPGEAPLFRDGSYVPGSRQDTATTVVQAATGVKAPEPKAVTPEPGGHVQRPVTGGLPAAQHGASRRSARAGEERVVLNFQNAEIADVIGALSRFTGRHFLLDPRVKGQITLVSDGKIDSDTAYGMLGSALRMRGFTIVDVGNVSRVIPVADARLQGGAVNDPRAGGGIVTRTFRLAYENAEALVPVLKPMIAPENSIVAYAANNTVVITDFADNLERIARIIESIDTPTSLDAEVVKVYNGVAVDIAALANEVLQQQGSNETRRDIAVLADTRSNSIVIRASSPARVALARNLVIKLDNAQDDPGNLHVVSLRNAQAVSLAGVLRGLLTGDSGNVALGSSESARAALGSGGMLGGAGAKNSGSGTAPVGNTSRNTSSGGTAGTGSQRFASGPGNGTSGAPATNAPGGSTSFSAGGVTVQADATTNTLIISAPEPMYRSLRRVIDQLDQRRAQVLVESLIVEVTENNAAELGIQWMHQGGHLIGGANLGGAGLNTAAKNTIDLLPKGLNLGIINGTIKLPGVGEIMNLNVLARALQSKGGANILSTPNILTLDNEAASIMVGKTVPFVSGQYITTGGGGSNNPFQTVEREDVGLKLQIRPQISEGGTVKLDIYQEVSSIDERNSGTAGIVTNKRALDTSVLLDDGQIMVLGGLMEDSVSTGTDSVPVLGAIPVLGSLFRYDSRQRTKTNLMVFLRPYVIRDANGGRSLTLDRYNFMRLQQSRLQPDRLPVLPDMAAPVLPPGDMPVAGRKAGVDLRPSQWATTREQPAPATTVSTAVKERPAPPPAPVALTRDQLPVNVGVTGDPAVLYSGQASNKTVVQIADVSQEEDAVRIAKRVRISGLPAYIISGPGGSGYAVRVDLARDAGAVDASSAVLRELGYRPELVVTP